MNQITLPEIKKQVGNSCQETALSMALDYFGIQTSIETLKKLLVKQLNGISWLTEAGRTALSLGLKTTCFSYNLNIYDPLWYNLTKTDIIEKIEDIDLSNDENYYLYSQLTSLKKYIFENGELFLEKPNLTKLFSYIDRNIPLLMTLNSAILYQQPGDFHAGHVVILTGYDKNIVTIVDPAIGDYKKISISNFEFALNQRKVTDIPAYALAIYK